MQTDTLHCCHPERSEESAFLSSRLHKPWRPKKNAGMQNFYLRLVLVLLLPITPWLAIAQESEQVLRGHKGDQAYAFRLLPPASFPSTPAPVLADLEKRHCMIPQSYEARGPENVIHGAFREKGSTDWAVLCSKNGTSTLLVYWSGMGKPAEIAAQADTDTADPHDTTNILGYARGLDTASPGRINETLVNRRHGPFDHDGIQDEHIEKTSVIHYYKNGAWMTLQGSE